MKLVLLGPPGAGKGTLANLLKDECGVAHISTGDILREELKKKSALGKEVQGFVDSGALVPDEIVTKLVEQRFKSGTGLDEGYMLDGFPRTKAQAKDLDRILKKVNRPLDYAIYMESTLPVIIQRLTGRRVCKNCKALFHIVNHPPRKLGVCDNCGGELYQRADDNEGTIKKRMDVYLKSTLPIIEYYEAQGLLKRVDGDSDGTDLKEIILELFDEDAKKHRH